MDYIVKSISDSGEVIISLNGIQYRYFIDGIWIPDIKKMMKYQKGKALEVLKKQSNAVYKKDNEGGQWKLIKEDTIKRLERLICEATSLEDLKSNLPDVIVTWEGQDYKGQIRPKGELAKVTLYDVPGTDFEYSWDTVLKAVNSGKNLIG